MSVFIGVKSEDNYIFNLFKICICLPKLKNIWTYFVLNSANIFELILMKCESNFVDTIKYYLDSHFLLKAKKNCFFFFL